VIANIAASIRERLLNIAKQRGEDFDFVLTQYAMQRLLYRLSVSEFKDRFLLKGALLFSVWRGDLYRPTRDIDLLSFGASTVVHLVEAFRNICRVEAGVDDGIVFDPDSIRGREIKEDAVYPGIRITGHAILAKARIAIQVDIGFGDVVTPGVEQAVLPCYLDLPAPRLNVYPVYTVIAEKFQAMAELGFSNSRMKDFFDIWLLSRQFDFDGVTLASAISATFANRKTTLVDNPVAFSETFSKDPGKQIQWRAFVRKSRLDKTPDNLAEVTALISEFLMPVAYAILRGEKFTKQWHAPGPWV
jgi:predicted nucleotidyltransferase component of viral defense system